MDERASQEAEVLRTGFKLGFFGKRDIERWADRQIAAVDEPSSALIDLSMNQRLTSDDVLTLLEVVGQFDARQSVETEIGIIGLLLSSRRIAVFEAVRFLWPLVYASGVTDAQASRICDLDHGYDLALEGIHGTTGQIESELRNFVTTYAGKLVRDYPELFATLNS